jgi:hypothetical protein
MEKEIIMINRNEINLRILEMVMGRAPSSSADDILKSAELLADFVYEGSGPKRRNLVSFEEVKRIKLEDENVAKIIEALHDVAERWHVDLSPNSPSHKAEG